MKKEILIAPSILAADFAHLAQEVALTESAGADLLHLDVMDGQFVPPISFGADIIATCRHATGLPLEVHLMTVEPRRHAAAMIKAGANRIIIHHETCPHLHYDLEWLKDQGVEVGVAINPGTPVESLVNVLSLCDVVLVMTVNPGWGGQALIPTCLKKVERLAHLRAEQSLLFPIEVDGGINAQTAKSARQMGASILVAGSYFFGAHDRTAAVATLRGSK